MDRRDRQDGGLDQWKDGWEEWMNEWMYGQETRIDGRDGLLGRTG